MSKKHVRQCERCGFVGLRVHKGICRTCYQRDRATTQLAADCHPDRRSVVRGLCRDCYRKGCRVARATCHPDRPANAFGLCRKCYTQLPEVKAKAVAARRRKKYNLSEQQFADLDARSCGLCEICRARPHRAVDHDHSTGKVRGLLCRQCNTGIGLLNDDLRTVLLAAVYLGARA